MFVAAFLGVVGVLQKFNPKTQTADVHAVGVQVNAKKAILDNAAFFVEQSFLIPLAFFVAGLVFKRFALVINNRKFIVIYFQNQVAAFDAFAVRIAQNVQFRFDCKQAIKGRHQEMPRAHGNIGNADVIYNLIRF